MTPPMTNKPQALDEQMIEEMARAMKPELFSGGPDETRSPVTRYERDVARQMARAAHSLMAAKVAELEAGIEAAFVKGADVAVFIANQRQNPQPPTTRQLDGIAELLAAVRAALAPHPEGTDQ